MASGEGDFHPATPQCVPDGTETQHYLRPCAGFRNSWWPRRAALNPKPITFSPAAETLVIIYGRLKVSP